MRPERVDIAAPALPPRVRWLGGQPGPMAELLASGPVLVHFFDVAQLNSVRALPYVRAWDERYRDHGLTVLGIHSSRFPFTKPAAVLEAGLARLAITHPVAQDSSYAIWHDYGVKGWPSLFLWRASGALAWVHFGEGEYRGSEEAIQAELRAADASLELPEPMEPLRDTDAPGALVAPPSVELFPGGGPGEPWQPSAKQDTFRLDYSGGGAYAAVDGTGDLSVTVDGGTELQLAVEEPGLITLAEHPRHESHRLRLRATSGIAIYSIAFAAGMPR